MVQCLIGSVQHARPLGVRRTDWDLKKTRKSSVLVFDLFSAISEDAYFCLTFQISDEADGRGDRGKRSVTLSKMASNLKVLASKKSEFKGWSDKLINSLAA